MIVCTFAWDHTLSFASIRRSQCASVRMHATETAKGLTHTESIIIPFLILCTQTNVRWCYLLLVSAVRSCNRQTAITAPPPPLRNPDNPTIIPPSNRSCNCKTTILAPPLRSPDNPSIFPPCNRCTHENDHDLPVLQEWLEKFVKPALLQARDVPYIINSLGYVRTHAAKVHPGVLLHRPVPSLQHVNVDNGVWPQDRNITPVKAKGLPFFFSPTARPSWNCFAERNSMGYIQKETSETSVTFALPPFHNCGTQLSWY